MAKTRQEKVTNTEKENEYSFLANLSHEVRTPMNAIVGISEMMGRKITDSQMREYYMSLRAATQNLLMVVNNVVDYDELKRGKLVVHRERISLEKLIGEVIDMARINIGDRDVLFVSDISPDLPRELVIDSVRIKQVLVYYLTNAAKCTKWGDIALVADTVGKDRDMVRFTVENTEAGLPIMGDLIESLGSKLNIVHDNEGRVSVYFDIKIFIPEGEPEEDDREIPDSLFAILLSNQREIQAITSYLDKKSIRYRIISNPEDLLGFEEDKPQYLITYSEAYRKIMNVPEYAKLGISTICLTNLLFDNTVGDASILIRPFYYPEFLRIFNKSNVVMERETMLFEGARILVVDDNAINLKVTEGLLKPYKVTIDTATGGEEAIRMIHKTKYDLVFMDYMMPHMDGIEATTIVRQAEDEYFKTLPIIALSANVLEESRERFSAAGMNDFVSKPIAMDDLEEVLIKWIPPIKQKRGKIRVVSEEGVLDLSSMKLNHVAVMKGISYTGNNLKMYISILKDFINSAPDKISLLNDLLAAEDINRYTIEVHSLKSLSKTIGADMLSHMAENLEKKGHAQDTAGIRAGHNAMLMEYEAVNKEIERITSCEDPDARKVPLLREKAGEILRDLFHAMEDFDYDAAERICSELGRYEFDSLVEESYKKLCRMVENIDYEGTRRQAIEMLALL